MLFTYIPKASPATAAHAACAAYVLFISGDPAVKGLALLAGPTTADAAAFIAKEADLASMYVFPF